MSLFEIKNQLVRDLAWVMRSPGLVSPPSMSQLGAVADRRTAATVVADIECRKIYEQNFGWVMALERDSEHLEQWIDERYSHRLGYYFENLLEFWLRYQVAPKTLHCHLQVQREKQTLGEFDYLFKRARDDIALHWEVAVKFYLLHVDQQGHEHWLGPQANDSLDSKLRRLVQHQLCLGQQQEGRQLLRQLGFNEVRSELFLKGYLFYPLAETNVPENCAGMQISSCHLRGWWCRYPNLHLPQIKPATRWMALDKLCWLSPAYLDTTQTQGQDIGSAALLSQDEVKDYCQRHFAENTESVLFAEMIEAQKGCWQEVKRGFVVNSKWPVF